MLLILFNLQNAPAANPIVGFLPILLIFAIFYFLLFMPMQRQRKRQQKMLSELQNGNVVLTNGGILGTIVAIEGDTLIIRVKPDNVKLQVARNAVASLISGEANQ
ncbi:MAG TPA: preprotein translocase subunit YajC [Bryobacteraceae bacterium]|nr:preprotein translocase subunit YajC [Bryobacteraceae bacterium]HOL72233.1 preprotein translocase subunit YajC [Bryobacteraceae bacterium]HOQ43898.1 preprotein translocase subunit YajC [Bryobacteraceae bacterium]HPQ15591.1 preprotein translocase subunit YajC [Bryobacteraceae bacterium]HPU71659.1 preprotein translocase subunit YajC [Bryobacteraceae bacterium]